MRLWVNKPWCVDIIKCPQGDKECTHMQQHGLISMTDKTKICIPLICATPLPSMSKIKLIWHDWSQKSGFPPLTENNSGQLRGRKHWRNFQNDITASSYVVVVARKMCSCSKWTEGMWLVKETDKGWSESLGLKYQIMHRNKSPSMPPASIWWGFADRQSWDHGNFYQGFSMALFCGPC